MRPLREAKYVALRVILTTRPGYAIGRKSSEHMENLQPQEREEIWFVRVVMALGAYQVVEFLLNLATILKIHSGLRIVSSGVSETSAVAYLVANIITGLYILSGGSLLSRLAYGRPAPRPQLYEEVSLPDWRRGLSVTVRSFGAYQMILAVSSLALAVAYYDRPIGEPIAKLLRTNAVEIAWVFERVVIGFALLAVGGRIAAFFTGRPSGVPAEVSNHKS